MKKLLITFILLISCSAVYAASPKPDNTVKLAISKYKSGNYSGCIQTLEPYLEKKQTALAYYYIAMSYTQAGRNEQAIESYDKAIELATKEKNQTIKKYAKYGKLKAENPEAFNDSETYSEIQVLLEDKNKIPNDLKEDLKIKHLEYLRNEINNGKTPKF